MLKLFFTDGVKLKQVLVDRVRFDKERGKFFKKIRSYNKGRKGNQLKDFLISQLEKGLLVHI